MVKLMPGIKSEDGGEISCEKLNSATSARESLVVYGKITAFIIIIELTY